MKKLLIFIIIITGAAYLNSCTDNITNSTGTDVFKVSGKVENWTNGNNKIVAVYNISGYPFKIGLDTAAISNEGNFEFEIKNPLTENLDTLTISTGGSQCEGLISINPAETKYTSLVLEAYNAEDSLIGYIEKRNFETQLMPGAGFVYYIYIENNVSITGTEICSNITDTTALNCNFTGNKGWQKICESIDDITPTRITCSISNLEPSNTKWYFYSLLDAKNSKHVNRFRF